MDKDKKECFCFKVIKKFKSKLIKFDLLDMALTKLAVTSGVLFLLTAWPRLLNLVLRVDWIWYFVPMVIFAIRPIYHFWGKKK